MHKQTAYKFQKIWTIYIDRLNLSSKKIKAYLNHCIPTQWQLILISDGSFTQNLTSLTGEIICLSIIDSFIHKNSHNNNYIRETILKNNKYIGFIFAKSSWPNYAYDTNNYSKFTPKPIGQSFIEGRLEIYKDIHEIYYGYCTSLDKKFQFHGPIWGRKYTIYHKHKPLTTIHEVFFPQIIQFFT